MTPKAAGINPNPPTPKNGAIPAKMGDMSRARKIEAFIAYCEIILGESVATRKVAPKKVAL